MDTDEDCCVICLAGFTNPVCTPCRKSSILPIMRSGKISTFRPAAQHMFCMQCLNGWISEAAEAGRTAYSCPSCRRAFDVGKTVSHIGLSFEQGFECCIFSKRSCRRK
ncbi:hypothetical protein ARMSODRAFT_178101 [Armillaria solidipes]|uniref:RING-type domain-containing protein n=1 Tax=Armillaria solidipes TaxID=1076256 RepID=A0A2H3BHL0_9AGAR|nr:hypothetical protein ARMSODRAFT_178101 [Armillaria solidipes]